MSGWCHVAAIAMEAQRVETRERAMPLSKDKKSAYDKARYLRLRDDWLAKSRDRNAVRRNNIREFLWDYKSSHPCVDCGESDPVVLDFDHVGEKSFDISSAYPRARGIKSVLAEIEKCEVRCANCHRRKTHARRLGSIHDSAAIAQTSSGEHS